LRFVISEIDRSEDRLPALLLAEFEDALIAAYLYANLNNYTDLLTGKCLTSAPWQVQRAIEYIDANWDKPITVDLLASVTETSARSLFATFRNSRGCSPMAYLRSVRLLRAREILSSPVSDMSVSATAAKCGFVSPSHFAKKYVGRFGESPSVTLKRGKQGVSSRRR
jgi:transcriptional regulator GlxA family with amidase domain